MRMKILAMGMIILMAGLAIAAVSGGGAVNQPDEDIIYVEGIGLDGYEADLDPNGNPASLMDSAENVEIDWSDNIVFRKFPAGQMVRTEVILHDMEGIDPDTGHGPAVYTIRGHLTINEIETMGGELGDLVYDSTIAQGLFEIPDGKTPYYSAEINKEGLLIYGYNWDTRGLDSGFYRLTFWVDEDDVCMVGGEDTCPDKSLSGADIDYSNEVTITSHDLSDTTASPGAEPVGFVHDEFICPDGFETCCSGDNYCIDIELTEKSGGRK